MSRSLLLPADPVGLAVRAAPPDVESAGVGGRRGRHHVDRPRLPGVVAAAVNLWRRRCGFRRMRSRRRRAGGPGHLGPREVRTRVAGVAEVPTHHQGSVGGASAARTRAGRRGPPERACGGVARVPTPGPVPAAAGEVCVAAPGHLSSSGHQPAPPLASFGRLASGPSMTWDVAWTRRGVCDHRDVGVHHQVETPRAGHHLSSSVTTALLACRSLLGVTHVCADVGDVGVSDVAVLTPGY
jgi:hypothetical protein